MDLSHPTNGSIHSGIPKKLYSLKYITVDSAIQLIRQLGCGTLLAKIDVKVPLVYYLFTQKTSPFINEMGPTHIH